MERLFADVEKVQIKDLLGTDREYLLDKLQAGRIGGDKLGFGSTPYRLSEEELEKLKDEFIYINDSWDNDKTIVYFEKPTNEIRKLLGLPEQNIMTIKLEDLDEVKDFDGTFNMLDKINEDDASFEKFVQDEADEIRQGKELSVVVEQIIKNYDIVNFERFGKHEHHLIEVVVKDKDTADKIVEEVNAAIKDKFYNFAASIIRVNDGYKIIIKYGKQKGSVIQEEMLHLSEIKKNFEKIYPELEEICRRHSAKILPRTSDISIEILIQYDEMHAAEAEVQELLAKKIIEPFADKNYLIPFVETGPTRRRSENYIMCIRYLDVDTILFISKVWFKAGEAPLGGSNKLLKKQPASVELYIMLEKAISGYRESRGEQQIDPLVIKVQVDLIPFNWEKPQNLQTRDKIAKFAGSHYPYFNIKWDEAEFYRNDHNGNLIPLDMSPEEYVKNTDFSKIWFSGYPYACESISDLYTWIERDSDFIEVMHNIADIF